MSPAFGLCPKKSPEVRDMVGPDPTQLATRRAHARAAVADQAAAALHAVPSGSHVKPTPYRWMRRVIVSPPQRPVCAGRIKVMRKGVLALYARQFHMDKRCCAQI